MIMDDATQLSLFIVEHERGNHFFLKEAGIVNQPGFHGLTLIE